MSAPTATLGDWVGCEPSIPMIEQRDDWRGQWLGRRGCAEKWAFWARVSQLCLDRNPGDASAARSVARYSAAAEHAPASRWWLVAGDHNEWDEPDPEEHVYLAGPFATEDEALEHAEKTSPLEELSAVPRLPGWSL